MMLSERIAMKINLARCFFLFSLSAALAPCQTQALKPELLAVHRHYSGKIGKGLDVEIDLSFYPDGVRGVYLYKNYRIPIILSGSLEGKKLELSESSSGEFDDGKKTGIIKASLSSDYSSLSGSWHSPDGKRRLSLTASENYSSSVGFDVWGIDANFLLEASDPESPGVRYAAQALIPRGMPSLAANFAKELYSGSSPQAWLATRSAEYLKDYRQEMEPLFEDDPESQMSFTWEKNINHDIVYNYGSILCLSVDWYENSGGAHPNYAQQYRVFSLESGKPLGFFDFFRAGTEERLSELLTAALKRQEGLEPQSSLEDAGFFVKELEPAVDNFFVSGSGISFHYPNYAIGPYVMGPRTIALDWKSLGPLLRHERPFK